MCVFYFLQDLATAERLKRQIQTERDELQDEINSSNTKKYEPNIDNLFTVILSEKNVRRNYILIGYRTFFRW